MNLQLIVDKLADQQRRELYKRPSDRKTKRGVSNDKLSVMVAANRKGKPLMKIAKMGKINSDSIEKNMKI